MHRHDVHPRRQRQEIPIHLRRELVNEGLDVFSANDLPALGVSTPDAFSKTVDGMVRDLCAKFSPDARYWRQAGSDNPAVIQKERPNGSW